MKPADALTKFLPLPVFVTVVISWCIAKRYNSPLPQFNEMIIVVIKTQGL